METTTYRLTIPTEEFIDEMNLVMQESIKFKAANPDVRMNSVSYDEISRDEIEIVFDITIEYEI